MHGNYRCNLKITYEHQSMSPTVEDFFRSGDEAIVSGRCFSGAIDDLSFSFELEQLQHAPSPSRLAAASADLRPHSFPFAFPPLTSSERSSGVDGGSGDSGGGGSGGDDGRGGESGGGGSDGGFASYPTLPLSSLSPESGSDGEYSRKIKRTKKDEESPSRSGSPSTWKKLKTETDIEDDEGREGKGEGRGGRGRERGREEGEGRMMKNINIGGAAQIGEALNMLIMVCDLDWCRYEAYAPCVSSLLSAIKQYSFKEEFVERTKLMAKLHALQRLDEKDTVSTEDNSFLSAQLNSFKNCYKDYL